MQTCECCGNEYDKAFEVRIGGTSHYFDSFQCAIQTLAPRCDHCRVPMIGQGIETFDRFFCCAHCARAAGVRDLADRAQDTVDAAV